MLLSGWIDSSGWVHCPVCGNKTRTKVNRDTVLKLVLNHVGKIKERISTIDSKIADCTNAEKYRLYEVYNVELEIQI